MNKEWNDPFNPFNSMKVLMWKKHLEACAKGDFLPPINIDIDPSGKCPYKCPHCNAWNIIHQKNEMKMIPPDFLLKIADFLNDWKNSVSEPCLVGQCCAGGGESLTNPGTIPYIEKTFKYNIRTGLITNGYLLDDEKIKSLAYHCRWIGFSMDAATSETYLKIKGLKNVDIYYKVISNLKKLCKLVNEINCDNEIAFKFLLTPDNFYEIYDAVVLAKEIGVKHFHLRPVGYDHVVGIDHKKFTKENIKFINEQIEKAMMLETNSFKVFGIRHKFNPDLTPKKNFKKCWAIPILPTFQSNGYLGMCFDYRGREDFNMCKFYPDLNNVLKFWNSDEHRQMVKNIDIQTCGKCTFSTYNEIIEKVIINDQMCRNFP